MKTALRFLLCLCAASLGAGCAARTAQVRGVAPLNVNESGESTPVDVRFYSLGDQSQYQRASFDALWLDAGKALGSDLLGPPVVVTVFPGAAEDAPKPVDLGSASGRASHIGVMALYRQGEDSPRTLVVPAARIGEVVIECTGRGLRLADTPKPASVPGHAGR